MRCFLDPLILLLLFRPFLKAVVKTTISLSYLSVILSTQNRALPPEKFSEFSCLGLLAKFVMNFHVWDIYQTFSPLLYFG
jgi:hypothetical protein